MLFGVKFASFENTVSKYAWNFDERSENPKIIRITTEIVRSRSADIPVKFTIDERASVKKVKLRIKPVIIPSGFLLPVPTDPDNTIGKIGRMHGERIVTIPARNAKINNINILFCVAN